MKFKELRIWQESMDLVVEIYNLTNLETFKYDFNLKDHMRSAATSVNFNIVEGYERNSQGDYSRFLKISKGSLGELLTQVIAANRIGYIEKNDKLENKIYLLMKKIGKLIQKVEASR